MICGRCRGPATFTEDPYTGHPVSHCCAVGPVRLSLVPDPPNGDGSGRCSKCGDNTDFLYDAVEGWVSTYCTRGPVSTEPPAWTEEG